MLELVRLHLVVLGGLALLHSGTEGGYFPLYEHHTEIRPGDGSYRYPDHDDVSTSPNYFISQLNFEMFSDVLVTGAANKLFFLNSTSLTPIHVYQWNATEDNHASCRDPSGSEETSNPDYVCNNHIRLYRRLPSNSSQVLVCGTQAVVQPQCRILEISMSDDGTIAIKENAAVIASDGLVSYYPQFSQFGEFRHSDDNDTVFLTAGFFVGGNTGVARHFSISYKNITMTTPSDPNTLETTELFRTINDNNNWLRFPVTFVGVHKADYESFGNETDYQFWFVFLRENLVSGNVVYSRLVRICRNDPGSNMSSGGAKYFTTYMKARIFCKRDKPSSLEFTASLDFIYNSITSFVFSEGRYYGDSSPQKLLYGSFTGPSNGPVGSALCVYPADNSLETGSPDGHAGHTQSAFDIFREDISSDPTSSTFENSFLECKPAGRQGEQQQWLFIRSDLSVAQRGDPLLILDDVVVTQMVQDSVCVVTRDDSSKCINQDVLFLGLDTGRVLKVVFRTDDEGDSDSVIAENIELDAGDPRAVTALELREVGDEKFLFVATETRVYKLPLQRCSRFSEGNCSECVSSRDPYCLYNTNSNMCELNSLNETEQVDSWYRQNIHTGSANDCPVPPPGPVPNNEIELIVFLTDIKCTIPLQIAGEFPSQLVEEVVTSIQSKCASCDITKDDIIDIKLFLSCSDKGMWAISLQGVVLSTDIRLSALSKSSEVTVDGHKLTVVCVSTSNSTSCAPPTSGVSSSDGSTTSVGFVVVLVLYILTTVGVLICIVLLLLYYHRKSIRRVTSELWPHTGSQPPSTVHPTSCSTSGKNSKATPTETSASSPQHKIVKAVSYQEAQTNQILSDGPDSQSSHGPKSDDWLDKTRPEGSPDPQSSLTPLLTHGAKPEDWEKGPDRQPRPEGSPMYQNTSYYQCGDGAKVEKREWVGVKEEGVEERKGEGEREGTHSSTDTKL